MKRRRRKPLTAFRSPGQRRVWPRLVFVLLLFSCVLLFLDMRLRPVVESMASYQARVFATRAINEALLQELQSTSVDYDQLVQIARGSDGMVTSVSANMRSINTIKSQMANSIVADLESMGMQSIHVPLGTLLGNEFFSGRGPLVEIKVIPTGFVQSEIYNNFNSAGINQTQHQIMLRTTVQMIVVLPGYRVHTETSTSFCIAETVIVGAIPDAFTQINEDEAPLISKLNDYAAGLG